jgi:hypothetical protein
MTTIENIQSTAAVALVLSGRIINPAAFRGQRQDRPHYARRARALGGALGKTIMLAGAAVGSARPESGLR